MQVIDRAFVRGLMPARDPGGHKGTFGKVYLLGGSVGYTGAPVLCAGGAVHSGCGLVFLGVPETVWPIAAARCLCAMPHPLAEQDGRLSAAAETEIRHRAAVCDAVAVGCGLSIRFELEDFAAVEEVYHHTRPTNLIGFYRVERSGQGRPDVSAL